MEKRKDRVSRKKIMEERWQLIRWITGYIDSIKEKWEREKLESNLTCLGQPANLLRIMKKYEAGMPHPEGIISRPTPIGAACTDPALFEEKVSGGGNVE